MKQETLLRSAAIDRTTDRRLLVRPRHAVSVLTLALALLTSCGARGTEAHIAAPHDSAAGSDARAQDHGHSHDAASEVDHADEVTLTDEAIARYGIKTQAAQLWVLRPTISAPAQVNFNTEAMAHVGSPLRGRITEVNVRLGDFVTAGQELVVIESPELGEAQADYLRRRVDVAIAGPAVELSRIAWERAQGLYEKSQGISLTEVQRREAEHKVSISALKAAESAREVAASRLRLLGMGHEAIEALVSTGEVVPRYAIHAAIDGVVVRRDATLGELIGPDREYLMVLADATRLWVLADVPESELWRIHLGAKAWVGVGSLGEPGTNRFESSVSFISPFVDPTTRTAQVRIELPSAETGLKPGMFAQAEIVEVDPDGQPRYPVVAVPEEAIQTIEGGPALFVPVEGEPNTYAKRAVAIGPSVGGLFPVYSGLVEGELFVSEGTFILKADLGKGAAAHEH